MTCIDSLRESIQQITGCSKAIALKVTDYYQRERILKVDRVNGSTLLVHGAFMDKDVLECCIERVK